MTKRETRSMMLEIRRNESPEKLKLLSELITGRLLETDIYKSRKNILTYVSYNNEADTINLIEHALHDKKNVYVPKVYGDVMHFHLIGALSELKPSKLGILEPETDDFDDPDSGLMIMPGVAFDTNCNRIGYGGGYYDRYIFLHPGLIKAAIAYDFQIVPEVEPDAHDICPDMIITEKRIIIKKEDT